jgi:hypothetical protein
MEELIYNGNELNYRGQFFQIGESANLEDTVLLNLYDSESNFNIILVANETSINGVLQTSAQMIIDTLTNA